MRWALLFLVLAGVCCVAYLVRGVWLRDGLALLGVSFLVVAAVAGLLSRMVERRSGR